MLEDLGCTVCCVSGENDELVDSLSRLPITELDSEQEVKELDRLRKVHEDIENLPMTFSVTEKSLLLEGCQE